MTATNPGAPATYGTFDVTDERQLSARSRELVLNMGPQHPSTHGVLRVVLHLDGESITFADPVIGYLHRGVEKLGEAHRYAQVIPWTDRTDYVAAPHEQPRLRAGGREACGLEAPERAQYWRVIMAELSRIASHLVWLGTHALDIGALSMSLYCFRERELILDIFEAFCGARLTTNMMEIGGFSRPDSPRACPSMIGDFLRIFPERQQEYVGLAHRQPDLDGAHQGRRRHPRRGGDSTTRLTGACLRGSGINYDIRKAMPYLVYDRLDFEVPLGTHGDVYDRYLVRMEEMRQAIKIIRQCLDQCRADGHAADGLRIGLRHPAAQGHDDAPPRTCSATSSG